MDKFSYSIGLGIGQNLSSMGIGNLAVDDFAQAIKDVLEGNQTAISHNEAREIVNKYFEELEAKAKAEAASPLMNEAREMLVKWEANDPEVRALWAKMNNWVYEGFDETYRKMGVSFDKIYYESNTYLEGKEKVMEGLEKGFFYKKGDGSV